MNSSTASKNNASNRGSAAPAMRPLAALGLPWLAGACALANPAKAVTRKAEVSAAKAAARGVKRTIICELLRRPEPCRPRGLVLG
ncbi:hypothetical protein AB4084_11250, partial [Lysobacter sp. 2RAB21]